MKKQITIRGLFVLVFLSAVFFALRTDRIHNIRSAVELLEQSNIQHERSTAEERSWFDKVLLVQEPAVRSIFAWDAKPNVVNALVKLGSVEQLGFIGLSADDMKLYSKIKTIKRIYGDHEFLTPEQIAPFRFHNLEGVGVDGLGTGIAIETLEILFAIPSMKSISHGEPLQVPDQLKKDRPDIQFFCTDIET